MKLIRRTDNPITGNTTLEFECYGPPQGSVSRINKLVDELEEKTLLRDWNAIASETQQAILKGETE